MRGAALATLLLAASALPARAFPPYRTTDADTADPWTLEARVGLRVVHDRGDNRYSAPLLRMNLGLPRRMEIATELEWDNRAGELADAAAGMKWVPIGSRLTLGVELLLLLPIDSGGGAGVEGSIVGTWRRDRLRVHVNATGFHDARPAPDEDGWKLGLVGEARAGRFRPGVEVQVRRTNDEDVQLIAGAGIIVDLDGIDLRAGVHGGLNDAAPDFAMSVWISGALPLR